MNRAEKQEFVTNFGSLLNKTNFVLIAHYKGLSVSEISNLREQVKDKKALFKVAKNSLAKRALKDTNYEMLENYFVGPTAVTISDDPVSAAKVIYDFSKENEKLKIIAAAMGEKPLSLDEIKQLASLPSMESLRAKIIGLLKAPMSGIVNILNEPSSKIVRLLNAKKNN